MTINSKPLRSLCFAPLLALLIGLWTALAPTHANAQAAALATVSGDGADAESTETAPQAILDAISAAASEGVTVVLVDQKGQVLTATGASAAEPQVFGDDPMSDASMVMRWQSEVESFRATLRNRLASFPNSVNEVTYILRATSPTGEISTYVKVFIWALALLLVARFISIELFAKRLLRRAIVPRIQDAPRGYREKMPFLVLRFAAGVSVTIVAILVAYVIGYFVVGEISDVSVQFTLAAVVGAFFLTRLVSDFWRMLLSPFLGQYRIPVLSDREAKRLFNWAVVLAIYSIWSLGFATWIHDFGLNYNVYAILYGVMELGGALAGIAMILFNRAAISKAILGGKAIEDATPLQRIVTGAWAPFLVVYFLIGWLDLLFDLVLERENTMPMIGGLYIAFMSVVTVYAVINYLIEIYFERSRRLRDIQARADAAREADIQARQRAREVEAARDAGMPIKDDAPKAHVSADDSGDDTDDGDEAGGPRMADGTPIPQMPAQALVTFEDLARRVSAIIAFCVGVYAMLRIWSPALLDIEGGAVETLYDVIIILFMGYIVYHAFRIWIDSKIAEETEDLPEMELGDEGGAGGASRLATLLPLFRGAILAIVVVTIALIALLELGVNVSPLFAGAGVVGLAVGFGAQTLVRDIFSGAFFLIDDAFRKGEYIDIGDVKGTVEKISVRSMQLRHHLGALNTIPFGEIKVLTNYSRDWVMMKLPLRVTYDTDVEKVRKLIKKLGQQLLDDPVVGDNFIQPLKSQGVIEMQDSAMIIRVKFMTKPGDQWTVRKRVYQEIRELFAREGIKFAHREVTVRLADGKDPGELSDAERKAVSGAVQSALESDGMLGDPNAKPTGDDR